MGDHGERRLYLILFLFLAGLVLLGARLAYLQFWEGKELTMGAVAERTLRIPLGNFLRGDILDCNGQSLTDRRTSYLIALFPPLLPRQWRGVDPIMAGLPSRLNNKEVRSAVNRALTSHTPLLLQKSLTSSEVRRLEQNRVSGLYPVPIPIRYGDGSLARHLIGSVQGAVLNGERERGTKGLEAAYDKLLRPAEERVNLLTVIDQQGNQINGCGVRLAGENGVPAKGNDLVLTIDRRVQQVVEEVLDRHQVKGSAVVMDLPTGQIRAMASRPNFDQSDGSGDQYDRSLGLYHPGSTFKILVAAAALAEGVVQPDEKFFCSGKYSFNSKDEIACWKKGGHGSLTFEDGFADSCNTVFVTVALRLGKDKLEQYARQLGLENGLAWDQISGWHGGLVKVGNYGGEIGNAALGQDGVLLSPVNLAALTATVARGGVYLPPAIIKEVRDPSSRIVQRFAPAKGKVVLTPAVAAEVKRMMGLVVSRGTGTGAAVECLDCGGKTGTAETGSTRDRTAPVSDGWFTGYVAANTGRESGLVITVFVEGGGSGGGTPTEIFHDIAAQLHRQGLL